MAYWFAIDADLESNPQFLRLRRAGSFTVEVGLLVLHRLWALCRKEYVDGFLRGHDQATLSDVLGVPGSVRALLQARFLQMSDDGLHAEGWLKWNGKFLRDNERLQAYRDRTRTVRVSSPDTVTDTKTLEPLVPDGTESGFETIWKLYPHYGRRSLRAKSLQRWKSLRPRPPIREVVAALEAAKVSEEWVKQGGQFVPGLQAWIRDRGWDSSEGVVGGVFEDDGLSEVAREARRRLAELEGR